MGHVVISSAPNVVWSELNHVQILSTVPANLHMADEFDTGTAWPCHLPVATHCSRWRPGPEPEVDHRGACTTGCSSPLEPGKPMERLSPVWPRLRPGDHRVACRKRLHVPIVRPAIVALSGFYASQSWVVLELYHSVSRTRCSSALVYPTSAADAAAGQHLEMIRMVSLLCGTSSVRPPFSLQAQLACLERWTCGSSASTGVSCWSRTSMLGVGACSSGMCSSRSDGALHSATRCGIPPGGWRHSCSCSACAYASSLTLSSVQDSPVLPGDTQHRSCFGRCAVHLLHDMCASA
jgi:hypothetical protein